MDKKLDKKEIIWKKNDIKRRLDSEELYKKKITQNDIKKTI